MYQHKLTSDGADHTPKSTHSRSGYLNASRCKKSYDDDPYMPECSPHAQEYKPKHSLCHTQSGLVSGEVQMKGKKIPSKCMWPVQVS